MTSARVLHATPVGFTTSRGSFLRLVRRGKSWHGAPHHDPGWTRPRERPSRIRRLAFDGRALPSFTPPFAEVPIPRLPKGPMRSPTCVRPQADRIRTERSQPTRKAAAPSIPIARPRSPPRSGSAQPHLLSMSLCATPRRWLFSMQSSGLCGVEVSGPAAAGLSGRWHSA